MFRNLAAEISRKSWYQLPKYIFFTICELILPKYRNNGSCPSPSPASENPKQTITGDHVTGLYPKTAVCKIIHDLVRFGNISGPLKFKKPYYFN